MKKRIVIASFMSLVFVFVGCGTSAPAAPAPEPVEEIEKTSEETIEETEGKPAALSADALAEIVEGENFEINDNGSSLSIVYDTTQLPHNYTDIVCIGLTDFVDIGKVYFESYDLIKIDMKLEGDIVTSLVCSKDNFNSVDWDSIAFMPGSYDEVSGIFDKFYVESMVMNEVDTEKVYYKHY